MKFTKNRFLGLVCMLLLLSLFDQGGICQGKHPKGSQNLSPNDTLLAFVKVTKKKTKLDKYWRLDYIKAWYHTRVPSPPVNTSIDLTQLSFQELWFLKNEILAKNGYLFMEPTLRAHFNEFLWYQPIFDVGDFVVEVTSDEYNFLKKIIDEEKKRAGDFFTKTGRYPLLNTSMSVNTSHLTCGAKLPS